MLASELLRMVLGLAAVIGMIGLCALAARKAGLSSLAGVSGRRRLSVSESLPLDARRRLALVRCDDAEYLLVLGPAGETVVAGGLAAPSASEISAAEKPAANPFVSLTGFPPSLRRFHRAAGRKDAA